MRYSVGVFLSPNSKEADLKDIVRNCRNTAEAIEVFVKSKNLNRAYAAYAYPVRKRRFGPTPNDWQHAIRCPVTGQISMGRGKPSFKYSHE